MSSDDVQEIFDDDSTLNVLFANALADSANKNLTNRSTHRKRVSLVNGKPVTDFGPPTLVQALTKGGNLAMVYQCRRDADKYFSFSLNKASKLSTGQYAEYYSCTSCEKIRRNGSKSARVTVLDGRIATDPEAGHDFDCKPITSLELDVLMLKWKIVRCGEENECRPSEAYTVCVNDLMMKYPDEDSRRQLEQILPSFKRLRTFLYNNINPNRVKKPRPPSPSELPVFGPAQYISTVHGNSQLLVCKKRPDNPDEPETALFYLFRKNRTKRLSAKDADDCLVIYFECASCARLNTDKGCGEAMRKKARVTVRDSVVVSDPNVGHDEKCTAFTEEQVKRLQLRRELIQTTSVIGGSAGMAYSMGVSFLLEKYARDEQERNLLVAHMPAFKQIRTSLYKAVGKSPVTMVKEAAMQQLSSDLDEAGQSSEQLSAAEVDGKEQNEDGENGEAPATPEGVFSGKGAISKIEEASTPSDTDDEEDPLPERNSDEDTPHCSLSEANEIVLCGSGRRRVKKDSPSSTDRSNLLVDVSIFEKIRQSLYRSWNKSPCLESRQALPSNAELNYFESNSAATNQDGDTLPTITSNETFSPIQKQHSDEEATFQESNRLDLH